MPIKPFIEVLGANPLNWGLGAPYEDPGALAWDITAEQDTVDISDRLVVNHNVDVSQTGSYTVTYNVSNQAGVEAEEKTRTVNVVITKKP